MPSVPPIWRKNVADDVATPMSCGGTAFWMASTSGCMLMPRPEAEDERVGVHARTIEVSAPIA